ncbi:ArsR/SmtB family transcription factor [Brevibacillus ginsengisoli]|uniref:ArsR/SmtB family transcription factor n=1 Tax=Brevibacillus ginsengisoli TaxID=363854 RepID=UPI003CF15F5A
MMLPNVIEVASLIGEKSRATILYQLMDGRMIPASELARKAGISPQTASSHLAKLIEGGLLTIEAHGRHRYYKLASSEIASVLEGLAVIAPAVQVKSLRESDLSKKLHVARTCYDHLAGKVGVVLAERLVAMNVIEAESFQVTEKGLHVLQEIGVQINRKAKTKKPLCRQCLDWSERRYHVAGVVGAALTTRLFELNWIERIPSTRAVAITTAGKQGLADSFGLDFPSIELPPNIG